MATLPQFQVEDQTDEDFFDKLVDDEPGVAGSGSEAGNVARALSNLSIGDAGDSLEDSKDGEFAAREEDRGEDPVPRKEEPLPAEGSESFVSSDSSGLDEGGGSVGPEEKIREAGSLSPLPVASNLDNSAGSEETTTGVGSPGSSVDKSSVSKGTGVKAVQWSAFNVDSQQFDTRGFESDADIFAANVDGGKSGLSENSASKRSTYLGSAEQQDAQCFGSAAQQGTDVNDADYWEGLYPGWKYDASTGQWYQIDGFDVATTVAQSDNYNAAPANAEESYHDKVSGAGDGFLLDQRSEVSYSQHTAKSVVGTVAEVSSTSNVSNCFQVSQGSSEYPPNMVFDPQYPGWYYDTNTQQWYTLESYTQDIQKAGGTLQDYPSQEVEAADGFTATENSSLYNDVGKFEQNTTQGQSNQVTGAHWDGFGHNSSKENLLQNDAGQFQQITLQGLGNQETSAHWNNFTSSYAKQNMWQKDVGQFGENTIQGHVSRGTGAQWDGSGNYYAKQNMWKPPPVNNSIVDFSGNQQIGSFHDSAGHAMNNMDHQTGFKNAGSSSDHDYGKSNGMTGFQSFVSAESTYFSQPKAEQSLQACLSHNYYGSQSSIVYSQKPTEGNNASYSQLSHAPNEGRSSAGRPPHALVAFGFGGKLIVVKNSSSFGSKMDFGSQDMVPGALSILSLTEVVTDKTDASSTVTGGCGYFHALSQSPFPGPLVGGSASTKDVNKYVDEKITQCQSVMTDVREGEPLMLLLSLLKISCQHYGKLRSPFGADPSVQKTDGPEAAVTNLFSSASKDDTQLSDYGSFSHSLGNLPSEEQTQATAAEVQKLLISGRRIEALQFAQAGQLWGPALVLAAQLGEKFYKDTVKQMALFQLLPGSPLRTLCLLISGQPADVFSAESSMNAGFSSGINAPQQPTKALADGMLDNWKENLAIITANRTENDELVIVHLGDCLWKERGQITAAHTCYLVAEANFDSYSDTARMCLLGGDHLKCPRTYASPEAIQRTELYEYSKVLGNSQFILLPFQPYKIIYAYMLAEVGKVSDSLKYCQASLKLLKNSSRALEVETWKSLLSSLEERLRTHQQGGYNTNLAAGKLVGKLFTSIDRSIHRIIGGPQSSLPPMPQSSENGKETNSVAPKVSGSQSTMAMSSLIPSASVEGISEWAVDSSRKTMHSRSVSEPDFGRSLTQVKETSQSGGSSRFGRIGSQLFQKTVGWVSRSRPDRQAKLGEENKFYYDEKLKRWVEEGAVPPTEEAALPPPPTIASFQNGMSDYNINSAFKSPAITANGRLETKSPSPSEVSSGIPPMTPSPNQFSARGSMGVRSRYVDTFNKGGVAPTNLFQSPSAPSAKPPAGAKFFVPATPPPSSKQAADATGESTHEAVTARAPFASAAEEASSSSSSQPLVPQSIQRVPSMDNITSSRNKGQGAMLQNSNVPFSSHSRAASWGGSISDTFASKMTDVKPPVDGPGVPSPFIPNNHSTLPPSGSYVQFNGGNLGNDLHEVQL